MKSQTRRLLLLSGLFFSCAKAWSIGESQKFDEIPELQTTQFCASINHAFEDWQIAEVHSVDINADGINELLLLRQANNYAEYHLFYKTDCGYKQITDSEGLERTVLYYSSSVACQPIGCIEQAYCENNNDERFFVVMSGRHTLTLEETWAWSEGKLANEDISSEVTRIKYKLSDGIISIAESQSWQDVKKNKALFKIDGVFDLESCK